MLDRRAVLGGLCGCCLHTRQAHAQETPGYRGCDISEAQFKTIVTPTAEGFEFKDSAVDGISGANYGGSSGDPLFDQALAITLSKLSDTFGVLPAFTFFTEDHGINAYSSPEISRRDRPHGTVAYGRNLLKTQFEGGAPELGSITGTCAHEFAHTVCRIRGTRAKLIEAGGGIVYKNELHADYLAGYFGGVRKKERPNFPAAEIALSKYEFGDYGFGNRGHHGTPDQRGEAVRQGFFASYRDNLTFNEAFERGYKYALSIKKAG